MVSFDRSSSLLVLVCIWILLLTASITQDIFILNGAMERIWRLDVDSEDSIYTWFSATLLCFCAIMLLFIAIHQRSRGERWFWHWLILTGGFFVLSLDETVSLHEQISARLSGVLDTGGAFTFAWVLPASAACALLLISYVPFLRALPIGYAAAFLLAGVLYVGGAVGMEMAAGRVVERTAEGLRGFQTPEYRLLTNVEEGLEGLGALLFLAALWSYAARLGIGIRITDGDAELPSGRHVASPPVRPIEHRHR